MSELPVLDATEQRILGSLMEKQVTVPGSYPMTLNGLRTACNQASSREPVVDYDDATLEAALKPLRERGLVRVVWADSGRRTLKYHQLLTEELDVTESEAALLTLLLLRGPQAPGELRTRSDRLHPFPDRADVEAVLAAMAARDQPLVLQLPRQRGQKDQRWAHLLGESPPPTVDPASAAQAPDGSADREGVLAEGAQARDARVRASYDAVAATYAEEVSDELAELPVETWLLDRVAAHTAGRPVIEVGCGPGHVTAHLHAAGADARGLDQSPAMVEQARTRHPGIRFDQGDLRRLIRPDNADGWAAVLAWYSLTHLAPSELGEAVAALARPLTSGGWLVIATQAGSQVRRMERWRDHEVALDFVRREPGELVEAVEAAGLTHIEWYRRGPFAWREETVDRLYLVARKP